MAGAADIRPATPRILIVEDDSFVALDLEMIVGEHVPAEVVSVMSVAAARREAERPITFALLDIDVLDGKTFDFAAWLQAQKTPFAFVSGSQPDDIPAELRIAPFIPKPYDPHAVGEVIARSLQSPFAS